jgi:hypothetical protein
MNPTTKRKAVLCRRTALHRTSQNFMQSIADIMQTTQREPFVRRFVLYALVAEPEGSTRQSQGPPLGHTSYFPQKHLDVNVRSPGLTSGSYPVGLRATILHTIPVCPTLGSLTSLSEHTTRNAWTVEAHHVIFWTAYFIHSLFLAVRNVLLDTSFVSL